MSDELAAVLRALVTAELQRQEAPAPKRGFSREEAAAYAGVSIYKVKTAIRENRLIARKDKGDSKDTVIFREDLDEWMDSWEVV